MATLKQIDANRRNAQSSTGPTSTKGKQASSRNALKSGIYAQSEIIIGECEDDLAQLSAEYHDHHRPATPEARALVDSLVRNEWLLRRLARIEVAVFDCHCRTCSHRFAGSNLEQQLSERYYFDLAKLEAIQRRINAVERNFHRSLKALQNLHPPPSHPQNPLKKKPLPRNWLRSPKPRKANPNTPPG